MTKVHTRAKRRMNLPTHKSARKSIGVKKKRAKTFKTESDAQKYASENNIKSYDLKSVKKGKKVQIVKKG